MTTNLIITSNNTSIKFKLKNTNIVYQFHLTITDPPLQNYGSSSKLNDYTEYLMCNWKADPICFLPR